MSLQRLKKVFEYYFNNDLNFYLYKIIDHERYQVITEGIGSYHQIKIYPLSSNAIIVDILEHIKEFKNSIYQILNDFKISDTTILKDTIKIENKLNYLSIEFYVCYGEGCPDNLNSVSQRAGIIPYFILNDQIFVILGIKTYTEGNVYSDFGWGCKVSLKELSYPCASRELREESLGLLEISDKITHIFGPSKFHANNRRGYSSNQTLYFVDYTEKLVKDKSDLLDISMTYKELAKKFERPELADIFIMTYDNFKVLPDSLL